MSVGYHHSNDGRHSLKMFGGGSVMLCTNGMATGSQEFRHKHTSGLNLKDWLAEGIKRLFERFKNIGKTLRQFYAATVTPELHNQMTLAVGAAGIIPWRYLGELYDGWHKALETGIMPGTENPDDWGGVEGSAWDWYNLCSHILKKTPPLHQFGKLEECFNLVLETAVGPIRATSR